MAYIDNQDIIDRVGTTRAAQLTADSGSTPDQDRLTEIRQGAEGEADSYFARRYAVPIDIVTHPGIDVVIKSFVLDIAVYRMESLRGEPGENVRRRYEDALKWLERVAKGEILLPTSTTPEGTANDDPTAAWGSNTQNAATIRDNL